MFITSLLGTYCGNEKPLPEVPNIFNLESRISNLGSGLLQVGRAVAGAQDAEKSASSRYAAGKSHTLMTTTCFAIMPVELRRVPGAHMIGVLPQPFAQARLRGNRPADRGGRAAGLRAACALKKGPALAIMNLK
jgi:hypothetical protein